nr:PP2C family protein-serine/threonine phosphatase [Kineococcus aurantiacus]
MPDGRVAVVVGDVAGHGVHAAAAMAQLRTALRAYLLEGHGPAGCLDRLDELVGTLSGPRTATAVVAVVAPDRATVRFASAGHPPPLLAAGGTCRPLDVPSRPLLGVGAGRATDVDVDLPPGGCVLLHSDGLVERRGRSLRETTGLLRAAAAPGPVGEDLGAFVEHLMTVVPGAEGDDTTLVALRRRP